jgi:hypothetical protein
MISKDYHGIEKITKGVVYMLLDIMMTKGSNQSKVLENGWVYSGKFKHYQKVNNKVYVYVTPQLFGRWVGQLYKRGDTGLCMLEARVEENEEIEKLFTLAEKWLDKYGNGFDDIHNDPYFPFQENWQGKDITQKELAY